MADPHAVAVRLAERTNAELLALFAHLGTREHPRGVILSAYRHTLRALRAGAAWRDLPTVGVLLDELRYLLGAAIVAQLRAAYDRGVRQAGATLDAYGLPTPAPVGGELAVAEAQRAIVATIDAQVQAARSSVAAGIATEALLLGTDSTLGVLTPTPVMRSAARWVTALAALGFGGVVERATEGRGDGWLKQAVATVDERTTDCCLRVHGQVQPLDGQFHLTGTPRFADYLPQPGFHWHCRTALALVQREDADDPLSEDMRQAAGAELRAREEDAERVRDIQAELARLGAEPDARARKGDSAEVTALRRRLKEARRPVEIHPSHATSGRG